MSIMVALLTAMILSNVVQAGGPYVISESPLIHYAGGSGYPHTYSSSGCYGSSCLYLAQSETTGWWHWNVNYSNYYQWYAWDPTVGVAAAYYTVWESAGYQWQVTVNQANHHGSWVYIGYSDYPTNPGEFMYTTNECVSGYTCSNLKVFWDQMELTTH